jgi:hypothetical protein
MTVKELIQALALIDGAADVRVMGPGRGAPAVCVETVVTTTQLRGAQPLVCVAVTIKGEETRNFPER